MKKIIAIILVLLTLFAVGCKGPETEPVDVVEFGDPTPVPVQSGVSLSTGMPAGSGMTAAGAVHSLGARTDGTVIAVGHNTDGQTAVDGWQDVVYVAAGDTLSIAVTGGGTVLLAGNTANGEDAALSWTDIKAVAAGASHVAGLRKDGTVAAAGSNAAGQCDVASWTDIVAIAAAGNHTVGLKADGTVIAAGDVAAPNWTDVIKVDTNTDSIVGVRKDGAALTTGAQALSAWNNLLDIAAADAFVVGVKKDGTVVTDSADDVSGITNAVSCSGGKTHVLVMCADGTVVGLGSNADFQINVNAWKLRPFSEEGIMVGFALGMTAQRVCGILNAVYGADNATLKRDAEEGSIERAALADTEIVYTGVEAFINDASIGRIAVRGDVNGDGLANGTDADMIDNAILGNITLTDAALVAAGIYKSVSGEIMTASAEAVREFASDGVPFPQFRSLAGGHTYDEKIATAKQVNPDVTGWITIPGTNMDFPIMKATKDYHYNDYTWDDKKDAVGSVYMYYNEARQGQFYAFTAHNNRKRAAEQPGDPTSMFHQLHHVYERNLGLEKCAHEPCSAPLTSELPDLTTYAGRVWTINVLGEEGLWEIFSAYETTKDTKDTNLDTLYDNIWFYKGDMGWSDKLDTLYTEIVKTRAQIQSWIDDHQAKNKLNLGADINVTANDKLMTIATCGTDSSKAGERLFFFLHKVG